MLNINAANCLAGIKDPLILDTGVVVNLNATGFSDRILRSIPVDVFVSESVVREIKRDISTRKSESNDLEQLIAKGLINILVLPVLAQSEYIALVSGSAVNSLGDGEAATIASAFATGAWAAIDEHKARKICSDHYKDLKLASTLDILTHPNVLSEFSETEYTSALLSALEIAHIQIQEQHMDWVVACIGADRIPRCPGLRTP